MSDEKRPTTFNPWPYSIVAFFAVAILAAVVWVVFCIGHGTDLVAADYYEQEMEYQAQLDRIERADELSDQASVTYLAEEDSIRIQLPPNHAASGARGVIHLYRPSQAQLDQKYRLQPDATGVQRLKALNLQNGLWDVRVQWVVDGQDYFVSKRFTITRPSS